MTRPLDHRSDETGFRIALRDWLADVLPADWQARMTGASEAEFVAFQRQWLDAMRAVGLDTPHWPKAWGGSELTLREQIILYEELARASAPLADLFVISLYHLPATLFAHGTAAQQARYLGGVRERGEIWCQGFSEPGAGSDLASLRTKAERRGDVYVVNGQKIWSSWGMFADYCLLLARTDPDAKKQLGISYFILDMKTPGITVRPIRQISGEAEFAEIFFDDVEIPVENLIGAENAGWQIAQSTLTAERGLAIFDYAQRMEARMRLDLEAGRETWLKDVGHAREYARFWAEARAVRLMIRQMLAEIAEDPKAGGMVITTYIKLRWATLLQDYSEFMIRMAGLAGQIATPPMLGGGHQTGVAMMDFMRNYGWTIAGGSNEIMRNVIAERFLEMPRG
ncbi:MAG: acyl-CoA dehydrogenase family protein [Sphingorhabdus sp.]